VIEPAELVSGFTEITQIRSLVREFSFDLEAVPDVTIRFKVWKSHSVYHGDKYTYTVSHHIHTPIQLDPYHPSTPFGDDEVWVTRRAVTDIMRFYSDAIKAGHNPSAAWFIESTNFD